MAVDPTVVALVGTIMGGVGLKVAEHWLGRNKVKVDDAARMRDELRLEITSQKEEITKLEADAVKWRNEYYAMYDKYITAQTESKIELAQLKNQIENLERMLTEATKRATKSE